MVWSRLFGLFFLGLLSSSCFAPTYLIPLLIPCLTWFLLIITRSSSIRCAFWTGWWFGFGHFTSGLYWISISFFTDLEKFFWLIPFGVFGLPACLAIYIGIVSIATHIMPGGNWSKATFFAIFWVIAELLRSYCFTGFPWNLLGYVWTTSNEMMQLASVIGTYGLSFVAIIIVTCLFPYLKSKQKVDIFIGAGLSLGLLSGIYGFGHYRLSHAEAGDLTNINLRIVQANIAQEIKWDRNLRYDNLMQYVKLSQVPAIHSDYHIIWPESAIPFLINEEAVRALIKPAIAPGKLLLTGSIRTEQNLCYNSISVIDDQGLIVTHYDKSHLVPFGEYVPLRYMLPSYINKITYGDNDFSAGKKQGTLNVGHDLPALSPIICYEVIFPQQLTSRKKAQWILNTTNDAWYGNSSGPYQHFNMARVRAVENGMPLVRAAGTGISGIIDSYGRVRQSLGLNERGVIDGKLPKALSSPTIYSIYGDKIILLLMLVIGGVHIAKDFAKK